MCRQRLSGYCCSPTVAISLLFTKHCDQTDCSSSSRVVAGRGHRDNVPSSIILGWAGTLYLIVCNGVLIIRSNAPCPVPRIIAWNVGRAKNGFPLIISTQSIVLMGNLSHSNLLATLTHTVTFVNNRQLFRYIFANRFVSIITLCNIEFKLSMNRLC